MQIESLKLFCDVARLRSFSRCAEENKVTQSTASQAVHSLEERLGVSLIDRSQRPWKLTPEGETFYHGCRDLLQRYADLEGRLKGLQAEANSVVRVASIYSVGLSHMRAYIQEFSGLYPGAQVHLEYLHPDKVYEGVLNEQADLGIVSFPSSRRELKVIPWQWEPMVLACSPEHPLAREKEIHPARLRGEKFVGFDRGLVIRREVDRFLKKYETDVEVALEFDNIEAIKRAVEIASGVSILPRPTLDKEVQSGTLAAVPFKAKEFMRPLGILHRRGRTFSPTVTHFIELLRKDREPVLSVNNHRKAPGQ